MHVITLERTEMLALLPISVSKYYRSQVCGKGSQCRLFPLHGNLLPRCLNKSPYHQTFG